MSNNNFWEKKQNLCVLLDIDLLSVARGTDFGESRACLGVYEGGLVQAVETHSKVSAKARSGWVSDVRPQTKTTFIRLKCYILIGGGVKVHNAEDALHHKGVVHAPTKRDSQLLLTPTLNLWVSQVCMAQLVSLKSKTSPLDQVLCLWHFETPSRCQYWRALKLHWFVFHTLVAKQTNNTQNNRDIKRVFWYLFGS